MALLRGLGKIALVGRSNSKISSAIPNRLIMTTRVKLEKVMEDLTKNPYFEKYAKKIATLQQTNPEEFLERVENKEQDILKKKEGMRLHGAFLTPAKVNHVSQRWLSSGANRYITTPIFYVNAAPHIGHLYSAVCADAIARYNAMQGEASVLLTTGTDEHGTKVQKAAQDMKRKTDVYCTEVSQLFRDMCDTFEIGYTDFVRTTEKRHEKTVHHFWNELKSRNNIYLGKYSGWYCTADEAFVSESDLKEQKDSTGKTVLVTADSGRPVEWTEEENFKFKLSAFRDDLKHWLKDENVIQPSIFHKIVSQWLENERMFEDLSVSRPKERVPWGVRTPDDESQNIYVWFDALVNYLTSLGYPDERFRKFWPPHVQVIGKDILKFHAIFWPAFLIAAGLEPPRTLFCHSHWTIDGQKMSKSVGNVICPNEVARIFTSEGLRYYLLRDSVPHNDANYATLRVSQILNAELADTFGNLLIRCTSKSVNPNKMFPDPLTYHKILTSSEALQLKNLLENLHTTAAKHYEEFYVHHVVNAVMAVLQSANCMVNHHEPWQLRKSNDPNVQNELLAVISLALESARISALVLHPVIPKLTNDVLDFLNVDLENRTWAHAKPVYMQTLHKEGPINLNKENLVLFKKLRL